MGNSIEICQLHLVCMFFLSIFGVLTEGCRRDSAGNRTQPMDLTWRPFLHAQAIPHINENTHKKTFNTLKIESIWLFFRDFEGTWNCLRFSRIAEYQMGSAPTTSSKSTRLMTIMLLFNLTCETMQRRWTIIHTIIETN